MRKFRIGNYHVTVEQAAPEVGAVYHHKDRDPKDMVSHVVPQYIEEGIVVYLKFYKDLSILAREDRSTIGEFNKWYRKGE